MSIQEPKFEDYVHHPNNIVNNLIESYFYLDGLSGKMGGHKFEIIDDKNGVKLQDKSNRVAFLDIVKNIIKVFSYLTVVVPIAMAIGKTYLRQKHNYTIVNDKPNKVEHAARRWRQGINLGERFAVQDLKKFPKRQ